jgi:hypothetical protein
VYFRKRVTARFSKAPGILSQQRERKGDKMYVERSFSCRLNLFPAPKHGARRSRMPQFFAVAGIGSPESPPTVVSMNLSQNGYSRR